MPLDRFMIAPMNSGMTTNVKPWLIPDSAFSVLQNAFCWRSRIRKRFGSKYMGTGGQFTSRARILIGTTDGSGNLAFTNLMGAVLNAGSSFSVGTSVFTVTTVPLVVGNATTLSTASPAVGTVRLDSTPPNVYQFRITGSNIALATLPVYWYPATPIMGLSQYEIGEINDHPAYSFDLQFAYVWGTSTTGWGLSTNSPTWHGTYQNFFWTTNWRYLTEAGTVLFVTNFNYTLGTPGTTDDPIYALTSTGTWQLFNPVFLGNGAFVSTAKLIVPFKNRLLLLYTVENDNSGGAGINTEYKTRCRFSKAGSPFPAGGPSVGSDSWLEPGETFTVGMVNYVSRGSSYIDAATEEGIVSCAFLNDRLIVYFERSTWEIVYSQNAAEPFYWQKLNQGLGSQSTFSTVQIDGTNSQAITIGNTGVHSCSGSVVQRIDTAIPDYVFDFKVENNASIQIAGIRDYDLETLYWSFPLANGSTTQLFPNKILVYNYVNNTWAVYDDCFTSFGYFEQSNDLTWATATTTWATSNFTWISNIEQAQQRQIIAGNQQGYIVIINGDIPQNALDLQISQVSNIGNTMLLGIYNHNLEDGDYIYVQNLNGITVTDAGPIYQVSNVLNDPNSVGVQIGSISGTYTGGGTASTVSNINILSKQFNPYDKSGRNVYVQRVDFLVDRTSFGEVTVDYYPSTTEVSMIGGATATGAILGNNILQTTPYSTVPLEASQDRLWHPIYFQSDGECIQLKIYMSYNQITQPNIAFSDFQLGSLILYTQPTSDRFR